MIDTTSRGMICSLDCATAESIRPRMAEATQVPATVTNSENVELPKNCGCAVGAPLPSLTMIVAIAACVVANAQNTATLASR